MKKMGLSVTVPWRRRY